MNDARAVSAPCFPCRTATATRHPSPVTRHWTVPVCCSISCAAWFVSPFQNLSASVGVGGAIGHALFAFSTLGFAGTLVAIAQVQSYLGPYLGPYRGPYLVPSHVRYPPVTATDPPRTYPFPHPPPPTYI